MAITPKIMASGSLSNTTADISGAPSGNAYVRTVVFYNSNTTTTRTVTVYSYKSSTDVEMYQQPIGPLGSFPISLNLGLDGTNGDRIRAKQDTGTDVKYSTFGGTG